MVSTPLDGLKPLVSRWLGDSDPSGEASSLQALLPSSSRSQVPVLEVQDGEMLLLFFAVFFSKKLTTLLRSRDLLLSLTRESKQITDAE